MPTTAPFVHFTSTSNTTKQHSAVRAAFSLIELCVVMVLVLLLSVLFVGLTSTGHRESPRKANCANNQRQIVLAMNVYANDNDLHWPVFTANGAGHWVPIGDPLFDPTATSIASFEFMVFSTGGDVSVKTFGCPSNPTVRPTTEAGKISGTDSISAWAIQGPQSMSYSYDWSVPSNASSIRVMTADRHTTVHKKTVMAAFADGHVGSINYSVTAFINKDAKGDDIYSDSDDGPMNIPGEGSTTRAFVR